MQEFSILSWIGALLGVVGLVLTWRIRNRRVVAVQSLDVSVFGDEAVSSTGVEIQYRGTPVPRVTSNTVWIWNAGNRTVRGSDIVEGDPLRFGYDGQVLDVRLRKVNRDVVGIAATVSGDAGNVDWTFDFLDPGDGGVLEVLHTGSVERPRCTGTIIGLPKGLRYRPREGTDSRWKKRMLVLKWGVLGTAMLTLGLLMTVRGILGILGMSTYFDSPFAAAVWFGFITLYPAAILWLVWRVRASLSAPSSLDL